MKKLSQDEMLNFVDGTLDEQRAREVDEYSKTDSDDARLLLEMREAVGLLREWDEAEPVHASADFWPKLREKIPASPRRSWWSRVTSVGAIAPRRSVWQLSIKAAVAAAVIALAATFFAPKNAQQNLVAAPLSPAAQQFIDQSVARHRTYTAVQPPAIGVARRRGRRDLAHVHRRQPSHVGQRLVDHRG